MHLAKRFGFTSVILAGALLLTACPQQETISRINADPGRYRNKEVGVVGTVTDSYGVLGNGAYEIDDGTGRIWVVTQRGVPSRIKRPSLVELPCGVTTSWWVQAGSSSSV